MCPHGSEFNILIRFHPPNHLPEDERSFSGNVASLKNMIQDKTNCSFEIRTLFREQGVMIISVLMAIGMAIGVLCGNQGKGDGDDKQRM